MHLCNSCDTENDDDAQFCVSCGAILRLAPTPASWHESNELNNPPVVMNNPPRVDTPNPAASIYTSSYSSAPPSLQSTYQPPGGHQSSGNVSVPPQSGKLSMFGMTMGIIVTCIFVLGLIPCLGWLNWFTLFWGGITNILCWVAIFTEGKAPNARSKAIIGLVLTFMAVFIGSIRLVVGGGCV